jgi:hypothetical protein
MNEALLKNTIGLLGMTAKKHSRKLTFCQLLATIIRKKGDSEELYFWTDEKFAERLNSVAQELTDDFEDLPIISNHGV